MSEEKVRVLTHSTEPKGWFIVEPVGFSASLLPVKTLHRTPVLAWLIESLEIDAGDHCYFESDIKPIVPHGKGLYVLQAPDGSFHAETEHLESEADVIEYFTNELVRVMKQIS